MDYDEKQLLPIGTMLQHGKYRVERHLASGGFGNTYIVLNTGFSRKFVLKEFYMQGINQREKDQTTVSVSNEMNNAMFSSQLEKFEKEAKRIIDLYNPHIIRVHDLFRENETAYYVMDYVDGKSLSEIMNQNGSPMKEGEVWGLMPQLFDALSAAHKKDILHLDIKPGNILMDAEGKVVLIDFGASKQVNINGKDTYSTSTAMCYTPGFAPSEQIDKRMQHLGAWTDIYALGATLYNLLTRQCPPLPSEISDEKENAFLFPEEVSPKMRQLIIWMMQIGRKDRPQSIDEIKEWFNRGTNADYSYVNGKEEKTQRITSEPIKPDPVTVKITEKQEPTQDPEKKSKYKETLFARILSVFVAVFGVFLIMMSLGDKDNFFLLSPIVISSFLIFLAGATTFWDMKCSTWIVVLATLVPNKMGTLGATMLFIFLLVKLFGLKESKNMFPESGKLSFIQQIANNKPYIVLIFLLMVMLTVGCLLYCFRPTGHTYCYDFNVMVYVAVQYIMLFILLSRLVISHQKNIILFIGVILLSLIYHYVHEPEYWFVWLEDKVAAPILLVIIALLLALLLLSGGIVSNWKKMRSDVIDNTAINLLIVYSILGGFFSIVDFFYFSKM